MIGRAYIATIALIAALALSACGGDDEESSGGAKTATVKLTAVPLTSMLPVWVALERGLFREQGIDVQYVSGAEGSPVGVPLVMSGKANLAMITPTGLVQAAQQGMPLQAVVGLTRIGATEKRDDSGLVVKSSSSIRGLEDLNGKEIALSSLKGSPEWTLRDAIDKAGGDAKTVKLIQSPLPAMQGLVESGKVDAAALPDPLLPAALARGKLRLIARPNHVVQPRAPALFLFGKRDWVAANARTVAGFRAAIDRANAFIEAAANREAVLRIVGKNTKIPARFLPRVHLNEFTSDLTAQDFQRTLAFMGRHAGRQKEIDVQALLPPRK
jgi:NitT/TauT family transport system substrate-binding protein